MNVLIVDDEPMTRALLRRVLTREFACTVVEATNGLEALSVADDAKPAMIVTDLRMPVMDGIELLEALRQFPPLAGTPVVMMSAARESGPVQRAIELGVTDYLLKPLEATKVAARLRAVVDRLAKPKEAEDTRVAVDAATPILIADGNADFRLFFATTFPGRTIHQAETGVAALQRCVATKPGIVFVGGELGVLGPDLLVRKLRSTPELAASRIFAIVPPQAIELGAVPPQVDGAVTRTFVADTFRAQVERLFAAGRQRDVLAAHPALQGQMASAVEQAFGMMLQLEVATSHEVAPRPVDHLVSAVVRFSLPDTPGATLCLTLRADRTAAQVVATGLNAAAAAKAEAGSEPAATLDASGGLAELAGVIAGRLRTALEADGVRATAAAPEATDGGPGTLAEAGETGMRVAATTNDAGHVFVLQLTSAAATAVAVAAPPAPEAAPAS